MKGYQSDQGRSFFKAVSSAFLANTNYQYVSGGDPPAIPLLKYPDLLAFHHSHYHPSYVCRWCSKKKLPLLQLRRHSPQPPHAIPRRNGSPPLRRQRVEPLDPSQHDFSCAAPFPADSSVVHVSGGQLAGVEEVALHEGVSLQSHE